MRVRSGSNRRLSRWLVLGLLALPVCGCAMPFAGNNTAQPAPPVFSSTDPVAVFAASAAPGSETLAVLPDGDRARLRLLRSYNAASGRECREVLIGTGLAERTRLVCQGEGGWAAARPLLSGSARP